MGYYMGCLIKVLTIATGAVAALLILYKLFIQDRIFSRKLRKRQAKKKKVRKTKASRKGRKASKKRK